MDVVARAFQGGMEDAARQIQLLEGKRARLLLEISRVDTDIQVARVSYGRLVNETVPINKLPHELLADIFKSCQMFSHRKPFEVLASHVSSHWREVALRTPLLWNTITLSIRASSPGSLAAAMGRATARLKAYLLRSDSSILDINLRTYESPILELIDLLIPHAHRWRRLSIYSFTPAPAGIFALLETPILEHLSLLLLGQSDIQPARVSGHTPQILIAGAPSLSFVRITVPSLSFFAPPLSAVTTLHLTNSKSKNMLTYRQFLDILDSSPCLINLSLFYVAIHFPRDPSAVRSAKAIPTLRSLRICGADTPPQRIFSFVALPCLTHLILSDVETFDSPTLPLVQSLTINHSGFSDAEVRNFPIVFPAVTNLSIGDPPIIPLLGGVDSPLDPLPWPLLQVLTLRDMGPHDVVSLCISILQRKDRGIPLAKVRLDKRSRRVLKAGSRLQWLGEQVLVESHDETDPWPHDLGYEDIDDDWC